MKDIIFKFKYIIIGVVVLSVFLIGGTYAWVNIEIIGEKVNKLVSGALVLELDESTCSAINLINAAPISDEKGMQEIACTFTLENTGSFDSNYSIYLDDVELESGLVRMDDQYIKYSLVKNSVNKIDLLSNSGVNPSRVIDNGVILMGDSITYELRLWIDYDATNEAMNKVLLTKLRIVANSIDPNIATGEYSDTSEANVPELNEGMIPVVFDESNSEWVKAGSGNWYNYDEFKWANAVTVNDANRNKLVGSSAGTVIPMEDINTMFVWIPRYSYTIRDTYGYQGYGGDTPSSNTPGAFNIKFVDSSVTELGSAAYTGDTAENWFTNSAFCWGNSCDDESTRNASENKELSGIWVGKFETGRVEEDVPIIVPNVVSFSYYDQVVKYSVSAIFDLIQEYMTGESGKTYMGIDSSISEAHLMKNTEWGAVAYLSQSKYGKYGNTQYSGINKEISVNNCVSAITGIGADTVAGNATSASCNTNTYETLLGQAASTTGTIYGIYDMSGGSWEYVMGNVVDSSGNFNSSLSGLSNTLEKKYYNSYEYVASSGTVSTSLKGDALSEVSGFYSDYSMFAYGDRPWLLRGQNIIYNSSAGIYAYDRYFGDGASTFGFRVVIS